MPRFSIVHPPEKPEWLDTWPAHDKIKQMFPDHLRRISYSLLTRFHDLRVGWNDKILSIRFGPHLVRWILTPKGWIRQCNCGYINDCCIHAYAAHCILQEICQKENWLPPPAMPAPPPKQTPPPRSSSSSGTWSDSSSSDSLFAANTRRLAGLHLRFHEPDNIVPESRKLEIEVDFHHDPEKISLRFYSLEDNQRNLLSMRRLFSLSADVMNKSRSARVWNENDQNFLRFFYRDLMKIPYERRDLKMYKCTREVFRKWREKWTEIPGRFIDRDTQEPLPSPGFTVPTREIIRLTEQPDDKIAIAAIFIFPDGRELPYHEILKQFRKGEELTPALRDFNTFQFIVSLPQLNRFFSQKTPKMPRDMICSHLSELIEGHLEIVEGDCVRKIQVPVRQSSIQVDSFNRQFSFQIFSDGQQESLVPGSHNSGRQPKIRYSKGIFEIFLAETSRTVQVLKQTLLDFIHQHQGEIHDFKACINANLANARDLKEFWQNIPGDIPREASDSLRDFLEGKPMEVKTELTAKPAHNFIQLDVHWTINDHSISDQDFRKIIQGNYPIFNTDGHWFEFSAEDIRKLRDKFQNGAGSLVQSMLLTQREARQKLQQYAEDPNIELALNSRHYTDQILQTPPEKLPDIPENLNSILRNYQKEGVEFLADRAQCGVGSILADDMGLGKTLQILTLLQSWKNFQKERKLSALVISPASVINVWQSQAARFCPELSVETAAGPPAHRKKVLADCGSVNILLTHYGLIHKDFAELEQHEFDFIILDEAQAIKNPDAQVTRSVKLLHCRHRLALTGTPLENRALDLWSIMDFINPGYLGSKDQFQYYITALKNYAELTRRLAPVILRRRKNSVDLELPPRTVEVLPMTMGENQRSLYNEILMQTRSSLPDNNVMNLLTCLTRLRQLCCDPELLLKQPHSYGSVKLETLREKLQELIQSGHSILVFSQFAQMLKIIAGALDQDGLPHRMITGETSLQERQIQVREFEESQTPEVFLLSLKAAGTGLTFTKADYVFLYDPWWNPAAENQAIDRTHRIGQTKPVMAYRMIVKDTVEEKVLELMRQKQDLFDTVVEGASDGENIGRLSAADLKALLR